MNDVTGLDAQSADGDKLERALAAAQSELVALRSELEETNRGVLALYAELDSQADHLRQATELKSRFLAYMSHEFRTPIGAIQSIARILQDRVDGPLTEEQAKQVGFIQSTSAEFAEMVNDLLDLAKLEAGRIEVSPAWFEMVDLFSALRGMFKPIAVNPDVTLIFEEPIDVPKLFSDDRKVAQILRNFISNALKFTLRGEIRVSAKRVSEESVQFAVCDTGIGIAPEFHHAIFQDYTQIDSPIQKRLRGTGLGLSLSKRLAQLLGGDVSVESESQKGSTFYVTIPITLALNTAAPTGQRTSS
ncbi:ATP-binding protein [Acidovorax sp. CCYZU-2555]|uniref:sensor histidine kinase n=1 Tax=Acidovorax sp. CCYZU-2555 TaxID=2835042 RepID=UPI001BCBFEEA|nr:ATP-binding protein [Acidovorax sp. CCYZU-2555]MBS7778700.1 histidine kinase [Acidovorax sp. CCYZU-2555]